MNCAICPAQATKIGDKGQWFCDEHHEQMERGEKVKTFQLQRIDDLILSDEEADEIGLKIEALRKSLKLSFLAINHPDEHHPAARLGKVTLEVIVGPTMWLLHMNTVHEKAGEFQKDGNSNHPENA